MRLLALDASYECIGWALFETDAHQEWLSSWGSIRPSGTCLDDLRADASTKIAGLIEAGGADTLAIEMPVMAKNAATTIKLAQLVGAIRLTAWLYVGEIIEIQPGSRLAALDIPIKTRRKVAKMLVVNTINALYKLELTDSQHDIADAIAVGHAALAEMRQERWASG